MGQVVHHVTEPLSKVYNYLMFSAIWRKREINVNIFNALNACLFFRQTLEVCQIQGKFRPSQNFPTELSPETVDSFLLAIAAQRLQHYGRIVTLDP